MPQPPQDNQKLFDRSEKIKQEFKERAVQTRAKELDMPYVNLLRIPLNPDLARLIPKETAEEAGAVLFFQTGKKLRLAILDLNEKAQALVDSLRKKEYWVEVSLCSEESLKKAHTLYYTQIYQEKETIDDVMKKKELGSIAEEITGLQELKKKIESAPFDLALSYVQIGAYRAQSSDIHFQPEEKNVLVRFRIDGILKPVFTLENKVYQGILREIKYLAHLKLNVTDIPQDGQYSFKANEHQVNVRVATLPTHYGETTVLRLLDPLQARIPLEQLGFEGRALADLQEAVAFSHGMILITGPTGSGKTTTLYTMLGMINTKSKKVITLEDPIEYNLEGVSQSQTHEEKGYTFAVGLRAILRQDPNVIMVGEIRDLETAETATQASLTGHLVFSTLHTNSAIESIPRLLNMGVKNFVLAPALDVIAAQRLVRKLCPDCIQKRPVTESEKEYIGHILQQVKEKGIETPDIPSEIRIPKGCAKCGNDGYLGQIAIAEVLRFDTGLRNMILEQKPMPQVYDYIRQNAKMLTLEEDGVLKAIRGFTTLEEVARVAK